MGLLDDAIREHLDLKRKHGGDVKEIARLEEEALGPAPDFDDMLADVLPARSTRRASTRTRSTRSTRSTRTRSTASAPAPASASVDQPTTAYDVEEGWVDTGAEYDDALEPEEAPPAAPTTPRSPATPTPLSRMRVPTTKTTSFTTSKTEAQGRVGPVDQGRRAWTTPRSTSPTTTRPSGRVPATRTMRTTTSTTTTCTA